MAGTPTSTQDLARVCRMDASHVERALSSLTSAGILEELDGPPGPRWRFRDRVVAAALAAELGGAERRRRHAAALVSARSWGASPAELLRHAVGAADAVAVVDYGVRGAEAARVEGAPHRALVDADRALTWWSAEMGPARRLAALHQRGMALLDLSAWSEAADDLEEAAEGWRALRRPDAAIASAFAASNARWSLGQHDAALTFLRGHLGNGREPGAAPSVGRAEALAQAEVACGQRIWQLTVPLCRHQSGCADRSAGLPTLPVTISSMTSTFPRSPKQHVRSGCAQAERNRNCRCEPHAKMARVPAD